MLTKMKRDMTAEAVISLFKLWGKFLLSLLCEERGRHHGADHGVLHRDGGHGRHGGGRHHGADHDHHGVCVRVLPNLRAWAGGHA